MKILLWLAVPLAITLVAMLWAAVSSRRRSRMEMSSDAAYERFSEAVRRPIPSRARNVVAQRRERPTGIAVRPSQRSGAHDRSIR